ncbi:BlaI/MecI/CopY family transcriptional regulator [Winogradskyella flava]|uniref:BlaI/MecI/CopY family transcriptional regulator n=1 Tax=Winogradskyella flava TaxID=1884876 RepID=A0A842ITD8_9FLAO|nr:BlaI/MecI/CopY family transcriptional regulator [Winogradskyella flava]MBC2845056.1 BlaI/MecI/CopY family transcriptional regulator [Winogradskyella flava]
MEKLTKREDQIMQIVWQLKKAFIREIIEKLPEPKPHYNSVATIVKILVKKGVLKSEKIGNTHQYSPVAEFEDYRDSNLSNIKKTFFGNSFPKMMAYFAKEENLSEREIEELIKEIKSKKS